MDDMVNIVEPILSYEGDENIFNMGTGEAYSENQNIDKSVKISGKEYTNIVYHGAQMIICG